MHASSDAGYSTFVEYFNKAEQYAAYIAAIILNPRLKWMIFTNLNVTNQLEAREA